MGLVPRSVRGMGRGNEGGAGRSRRKRESPGRQAAVPEARFPQGRVAGVSRDRCSAELERSGSGRQFLHDLSRAGGLHQLPQHAASPKSHRRVADANTWLCGWSSQGTLLGLPPAGHLRALPQRNAPSHAHAGLALRSLLLVPLRAGEVRGGQLRGLPQERFPLSGNMSRTRIKGGRPG
jgi:hypothetical protein